MSELINQANGMAINTVVSRQTQEVQGAIFMAKQFPRDPIAAETRIIEACRNRRVADSAAYSFPRSGQTVTGPSIRLAEVVSQAWGNIDYGIIELSNENGLSEMMAYAWDLETNVRRSMIFSVKHERDTKSGQKKLTENRDIYEMTANMGARRVRACILGVIPAYIIDAAMEQCEKTKRSGLEAQSRKPGGLDKEIKKFVAWFEQRGVPAASLEGYAGKQMAQWGVDEVSKIYDAAHALSDGMTGKAELFPELAEPQPIQAETSDEAADLNEQLGLGGGNDSDQR